MSLPRREPRRPVSFKESLRQFFLGPLIRLLSSLQVRPDTLTVVGWILSLVAALLFGDGRTRVAGAVMLAAGLFDALDGAVARQSNRSSPFGAFLDSTLDRFSESAVFVGIMFFYASFSRPVEVLLTGLAMTFSLLTSYTRARAEGLGYECQVGLLERAGRVVLLSGCAILGILNVGVWAVALGALITSFQRILYVRRVSLEERKDPSA
ncbi:CDP-alcohol phosphatidyltransferase family protein [Rubrobacter calidifluminis]|uniref:CDP-alcohol phosphatidyltransferase family protein n=1 Tax=Rubrobacter calidifluminis TaxID=1392640 RepID=UPI00235EB0A2|nr:CDP-alcohol phosphatidyltransferase family protein [Rubrobacter calidifluminis]